MKRIILFLSILATIYLNVSAQYNWKLISSKDNINIYTSIMPKSKIKAVKVNCSFNSTPSQFVALIFDIKAAPQWVYHTKSSTLIKQVSLSELYYHSEIELPWPLKNRDFVAHLTVQQDPVSKTVTIDGPVVSGFVPLNSDLVRINNSKGKWIITPISSNKINVEYTLYTDPGGNLPAWLINMFATEGPEQIFKMLKVQLQNPIYKNSKLAFLIN